MDSTNGEHTSTPSTAPHPAAAEYRAPPRGLTDFGVARRVGVEIEFAGLSIEQASALVRGLYGGKIVPINRFATSVRGTSLGDFRVEIDSMPLKEQRYRAFLDKIGAGDRVTDVVEDLLETVARQWIPSEIVTAPLAIDDLHQLEALRCALLGHNAEGTRASPLYGFAFQLNPEVPSLDAGSLTRHLKAFVALYDWLAAVIHVDPTRAMSPYVDVFPAEYRRKLLAAEYTPDVDTLIDDYLVYNPTRNRPLDMLPVFATLRRDVVLAKAKEHDQVKPRPTFHYRLPNCLVDDPSWSFALEWNRWVEVERLADDSSRLESICAELLAIPDGVSLSRGDELQRAWGWGITAP
jgi:hypothetical protein